MSLGLLCRHAPPLAHPKIFLVPLGPSTAFVHALLRDPPPAAAPPHAPTSRLVPLAEGRATLYYVNHAPTPARVAILEQVTAA